MTRPPTCTWRSCPRCAELRWPAAAARLRWCLRVGAAFVLRSRARVSAADLPAEGLPALVAADPALAERYSRRFGEPVAQALHQAAERAVEAVRATNHGERIAELLSRWQREAIARALVERNRGALSTWARRRARLGRPTTATRDDMRAWLDPGGVAEHTRSPRRERARDGRGRPRERDWTRVLVDVGLRRRHAEDLLYLAALKLPASRLARAKRT